MHTNQGVYQEVCVYVRQCSDRVPVVASHGMIQQQIRIFSVPNDEIDTGFATSARITAVSRSRAEESTACAGSDSGSEDGEVITLVR